MRLWYRDPFQKIVLATFAGTLTFSFSLLRRVTDNAVPNIGVTAAGVLVTISVLLLLWYVARFAHALRPVAVAAQVAAAGRRVVDRLPRSDPATIRISGGDETMTIPAGPSTVVRSARAGAIQAIDGRGLMALAHKHECTMVLLHSVGDFVPTGAGLVRVHGRAPRAVQRRLRRMFALGRERTLEQDPAFALRILVDIAIRALSPAVNDPTTAVQVLDYIEASCCTSLGGGPRVTRVPRRAGPLPGRDTSAPLGAVPRTSHNRDPAIRRRLDPGVATAAGDAGRTGRRNPIT